MTKITESELYDKLMKIFGEMMKFDNENEDFSPFSCLIQDIAQAMAEYEDKIIEIRKKR